MLKEWYDICGPKYYRTHGHVRNRACLLYNFAHRLYCPTLGWYTFMESRLMSLCDKYIIMATCYQGAGHYMEALIALHFQKKGFKKAPVEKSVSLSTPTTEGSNNELKRVPLWRQAKVPICLSTQQHCPDRSSVIKLLFSNCAVPWLISSFRWAPNLPNFSKKTPPKNFSISFFLLRPS